MKLFRNPLKLPGKVIEPSRPNISTRSVDPDLYYPLATIVEPPMTSRGHYRRGYPEGAVVHYTAGRGDHGAMAYGRIKGYSYLLIDDKGVVYQAAPLNQWGYHAGDSKWEGLGSGVSRYLVGIEMACPGRLEKRGDHWCTWWGDIVDPKWCRTVEHAANIRGGTYFPYTPAQEDALITLLLWLRRNNPDVFKFDLVLGHDEVSPGRKCDPGGSLSMTMPAFRDKLKKLETL